MALRFFSLQAVEVLAEKWSSTPRDEHIPLCESMMALAIQSMAVSGMGKTFKKREDVLKFAHAYEEVRMTVCDIHVG